MVSMNKLGLMNCKKVELRVVGWCLCSPLEVVEDDTDEHLHHEEAEEGHAHEEVGEGLAVGVVLRLQTGARGVQAVEHDGRPTVDPLIEEHKRFITI